MGADSAAERVDVIVQAHTTGTCYPRAKCFFACSRMASDRSLSVTIRDKVSAPTMVDSATRARPFAISGRVLPNGARPKVTIEDANKIWLAKLPERNDSVNMQRIEYATLELAREAGLHVCGTRLERVGSRDALMLERFDREWNSDAKAYLRHGLISGLTVLGAEDGYGGRARWSYLLLADELRRWSRKADDDRRELFKRMVFNAMVTNNDDHPRNHALLNRGGGWRLSPAYDIVPKPMVSHERRDLALDVGQFGRAASLYNLLSQCEVFGLTREDAQAEVEAILKVVKGWREYFSRLGVDEDGLKYLDEAMLPPSFFLEKPPEPV